MCLMGAASKKYLPREVTTEVKCIMYKGKISAPDMIFSSIYSPFTGYTFSRFCDGTITAIFRGGI